MNPRRELVCAGVVAEVLAEVLVEGQIRETEKRIPGKAGSGANADSCDR